MSTFLFLKDAIFKVLEICPTFHLFSMRFYLFKQVTKPLITFEMDGGKETTMHHLALKTESLKGFIAVNKALGILSDSN